MPWPAYAHLTDGELAAIALQPWEAPRVVVRPQDIAWSDAR